VIRWRSLFGFVLVGVVLHALLYVAFTGLVRNGHKAFRGDRAFVMQAPEHISLLICGDSHPRTAIDPALLGENVVNIAIGGEHYLKTWYRMRALVERTDRRVDAMLLPLDAGSFSAWHAENFAPEYVWGRYVDFLEVGRIRGEPGDYVGRQLKASLFPYAGELRTLNQIRTKRFGFGEDLPMGSFGALTLPERRAGGLAAAKDHFQNVELMDPGLRWAFDQLVAWADARGTKLVFVAFPVTSHYSKWAERLGIRERIRTEIAEPLSANPNHLFLDHQDLFDGRDEFFSDPHHLNAAGRIAFSKRLRRELVENGILAGP
jgi:hypothetical protein